MAIGAVSAVAADGPAGLVLADNAPVVQAAPAAHAAMIADPGQVVEIATTADQAEGQAPADNDVPAAPRIGIGIASSVLRRNPSGRSCAWKFCPSR